MRAKLDAVIFDIGGTLVAEADPTTAVDDLVVTPLGDVGGDLELLAQSVRVGAATDTSVMTAADVRALLTPSGIAEWLEAIVTSVDAGAAKPDPASLRAVMAQLGATDPSRVLFVGDRDRDAAAAAAAGTHYVPIDAAGPAAAVAAWLSEHADDTYRAASASVTPPSADARAAATARQEQLTKPSGSLGQLEQLGIELAAMAGDARPADPSPGVVVVFAGDHGVLAEGVSPWPQEVTTLMASNFSNGGAAINAIAGASGLAVRVVDVGIASTAELPGVLNRKVRLGTANLAKGEAMTTVEARAALDVGAVAARDLAAEGYRCLLAGDMGIGNTTASAALIAAYTGDDARRLTGRGTGVDDATLELKASVVEMAVARVAGRGPLDVLAAIGGLEIAAIAGFITGAAAARRPVILDGVIALAGAVTAEALCPGVRDWCIAGHRSTEPAASAALEFLGLSPILNLQLRLGEGSGAALAYPIVRAAAAVLREMVTFDDLGIQR